MMAVACGAETDLLERGETLVALEQMLDDVTRTSHGRLTFVRGEAGVGKTALVRRFCETHHQSARILQGACEALSTPEPLAPLAEIARLAGGELEERVGQGAVPYRVFSALTDEIARHSPTLLVLEDLHWADEATLDVVRLLGRRTARVPALVIATYRDDELDRRHLLRVVLGELARNGDVESLEVAPLSADAVARMAVPYEVGADELYRTTGGNPFYVTEVLAAGTTEPPSTVRDAVLARVAGLHGDGMTLLEALSVFPGGVQVAFLGEFAGDAAACLDECIGSGMVVSSGNRVAFRHELARLVIEESISPDRRVALHAEALRRTSHSADHALLAYHAEAAADSGGVLRFAVRAAKRAAAVGAHRESADQYARALRCGDMLGLAERAELLERRSHECALTDEIDESLDALLTAIAIRHELGDVPAEAFALVQCADLLWALGWAISASDANLKAVALLEPLPPSRALALAYAGLAQHSTDAEKVADAISWGTRALELARTLGEQEIVAHALLSVGTARVLNGQAEGMQQIERSITLAREAGFDEVLAVGMINLAWIAMRHRDHRLARTCIEPGLRQAAEHGWEISCSYLLAYRAQIELDRGLWDTADETASQVLRRFRASRIPRILALTVVARAHARQGGPEVWDLLAEASSLAQRGEELQAEGPVAAARAEAAWLEGDRDGVLQATSHALVLARQKRAHWIVSELTSWRRRAGIIDHVSREEMIGPFRLELAGDWAAAAMQWRVLGCPYEAALALAEADDETLTRDALTQLQTRDAQPAVAIVARRLRSRGVRHLPRGPRPQTRSNPAGLTARELDVLPLLTQGERNSKIAEQLFISPRTVDHHVSAIIHKLGAGTRGEAVAEATRLGLATPRRAPPLAAT